MDIEQRIENQNNIIDELENLDIELSDTKIVELFISTEEEAQKYIFQGKFYPSYWPDIKRIYTTSMRGIDMEIKVKFFYHLLRHNLLYPSLNSKNYEAFKMAFIELIPLIYSSNYDYQICSFNEEIAQILFNTRKVVPKAIFDDIDYNDFKLMLQFVNKCNSYYDSENIIKKNKQFEKFLQNKKLITNLSLNIRSIMLQETFDHNKVLYGVLVLIVISSESLEDNILYKLHREKLYPNTIIFLKNYFYNYFENNTQADRLQNDLNMLN